MLIKLQGQRFSGRVNELKEDVIEILNNVTTKPLEQLELIDDLQRLGLGYHFEHEIRSILKKISEEQKLEREDLHATALEFRLLRQHGFDISEGLNYIFLILFCYKIRVRAGLDKMQVNHSFILYLIFPFLLLSRCFHEFYGEWKL